VSQKRRRWWRIAPCLRIRTRPERRSSAPDASASFSTGGSDPIVDSLDQALVSALNSRITCASWLSKACCRSLALHKIKDRAGRTYRQLPGALFKEPLVKPPAHQQFLELLQVNHCLSVAGSSNLFASSISRLEIHRRANVRPADAPAPQQSGDTWLHVTSSNSPSVQHPLGLPTPSLERV